MPWAAATSMSSLLPLPSGLKRSGESRGVPGAAGVLGSLEFQTSSRSEMEVILEDDDIKSAIFFRGKNEVQRGTVSHARSHKHSVAE